MEIRDAVWRMAGLCLVAGILVAGMLFPVVGGLGVVSNQTAALAQGVSDDLVSGKVPLATTVLDRNGDPIAYLYDDQNRLRVPGARIADTMKAAIIAIEDRRFFEHGAVDWRGTARALVNNVASNGSPVQGQGASTLTMQYVQNYLLYAVADTPQQQQSFTASTVPAKLREVRIALQVDKRLSKQQILTRYLNIVYFGNNAYGIRAAAQTYFDTTPAELTIPQAALLAGLVRAPSQFDPVDNPEAAIRRRNVVIAQMGEVGSIDSAQAQQAMAAPLGIQQPLTGVPHNCIGAEAPYGFFCKYLVNYLERHGWSDQKIHEGGYTIKTTLSPKASKAAKQATTELVPTRSPNLANAMTVIKPGKKRHEVWAATANRNYGLDPEQGETTYALPTTVVPFGAGSTYKIFTAAAVLAQGLGIYSSVPIYSSYTAKNFKDAGGAYTVQNASSGYPIGDVTLQKALAISPNTTFVALEDRLGSVDPVVDMAYKLGMRRTLSRTVGADDTEVRKVIKQGEQGSFTLGVTPTDPLELANVAATLMSGGTWCPPTPIMSITDRNGRPVRLEEPSCEQVVPDGLANTLVTGLSKDVVSGTASSAANAAGWTRPMLGKTGTTQNFKSVAFVGATPQFAGATFLWDDTGNPTPIYGGDVFGADVAPTWFRTMKPLHEGLPVQPLPPTTKRYETGGQGATVPDVTGLQEDEAIRILEDAGYEVDSDLVDSARSYGIVVGQSPNGDDTALPGQTVSLSVSDGTPPPKPEPEPAPTANTAGPPPSSSTRTSRPPLDTSTSVPEPTVNDQPASQPSFTDEPPQPAGGTSGSGGDGFGDGTGNADDPFAGTGFCEAFPDNPSC